MAKRQAGGVAAPSVRSGAKQDSGLRGAAPFGLGTAVPPKVLTNDDLTRIVETSDEWIVTRTGIRERRIAESATSTTDLAVEAARAALAEAGMAADQLDLILVATITPDCAFPSTACLVQHRLGIPRVPAFDLAAACSGFLYATDVAAHYIRSRTYDHVLVIGAETFSRAVDWTHRSTCVLVGDGAGAMVLGPSAPAEGVLGTVLRADGSGADLLFVPTVSGQQAPNSGEVQDRPYMYMHGREIFKQAVTLMTEVAGEVLAEHGLTAADVDCFVPHQANYRIIEYSARQLGLPMEKVAVNIDRYGNTSAASIPLAMSEAVERGQIRPGDLVLTAAFGAGLTWGAGLIRWV